MSPNRAAAERRVINAAKQIERAAGYGSNTRSANAEYDRARAEQARHRQEAP